MIEFQVGDLVKPVKSWGCEELGLVAEVEKSFYGEQDRIHVEWVGLGCRSTEPSSYLEKL